MDVQREPDYPGGFKAPAEVLFTSAALPAAGAELTKDVTLPARTKRVTLWVSYTRGAAGGLPGLTLSVQPAGSTSFFRSIVLDLGSFVASAPTGSTNFYVERLLGPAPADGTALLYLITIEVPASASVLRVGAAEVGVTATPGTLSMLVSADG